MSDLWDELGLANQGRRAALWVYIEEEGMGWCEQLVVGNGAVDGKMLGL